jgi:dipeptidyl aminopeptidase/acylaminoacyl peptidase
VVPDSVSFIKPIYRVRVGPFATEEAAFAHLGSLREQGFLQAYLIKIERAPSSELASSGIKTAIEPKETDPLLKRQLTFSGGCSNPKWSPNGQEIAFYRKTSDLGGIYTVGTGGGHVSRIIESTDVRKITPEFAWAPSGAKLAIKAEQATDNWEPAEAVWVVNKRGTAVQEAFQISNEWQSIVDLSWSHDGTYIAAGIQDAEFSSTSSSAVKIRIEKSPSLVNDSIRGSSSGSSILIEPLSYSDNRLIAGGWQDRNHYLYFSLRRDIDETNGEAVYDYELWSYDLSVRESFHLTPSGDRGVLFGRSGIAAVDLTSGREIKFADGEFESMSVQALDISHSNQVYFLANRELWSCNFDDEKEQAGITIDSPTLTVSPLSAKLCFTEAGNLFTVRMPHK